MAGVSGLAWAVLHEPKVALPSALPPGIETGVTGEGNPFVGSAQASVTLDEFVDFQCLLCREFVHDAESKLLETYVAPGRARIVVHTVAFFGGESATAAEGARCAQDRGKFWEYRTVLYRAQETGASGPGFIPSLLTVARQVGLDARSFRTCLESRRYLGAISRETRRAVGRGVTVMPALFINGRKMTGDVTFARIASLIEDAQSASK
jgi:protein-disulfide isomerase